MRRKLSRRLGRITIALLALPALWAAACYVKWTVFDHRLTTITADAVYQSGAFDPKQLVAVCQDHGIKTVIDLRNELPQEVTAAAQATKEAGIHHVNLPTLSHPHLEEAHAFLALMDQVEKPVLVHCQHGEGRSVMLCAVYRMQHEGWSNQQAFDATARLPESLRFLNHWFPGLRRFRENDSKGQFVLHYHPVPATELAKQTPLSTPAK